ncbi:DUF6233 domain-containing protein [Streptomyces sp. NPDC021622]|uniref:DUF6233 domain-containing protein n=1 Tax=Streptomyces sp. NPDC021622 TaxID=3155013 RepID=UPI0034102F69
MFDLPSDLERLRVIELYLRIQLKAVEERISKAEQAREQAEREAEKERKRQAELVGWWLEHIRAAVPTNILHKAGCPMAGKRYHRLNESEAKEARSMHEVKVCQFCQAAKGL